MESADTPTGMYKITGKYKYEEPDATYGTGGLRLDGIGGEAKDAYDNGRTGINLHGGPLRAAKRAGTADGEAGNKLNYTLGCNRVSNNDMTNILNKIENIESGRGMLYKIRNKLYDALGKPTYDSYKVKEINE